MKQKQFIILVLSFLSSNIFAQSLATNILFEQAKVVYKGRVEKISFSGDDAEGQDFGISTIVEKVYKNNFYGERIGIRVSKTYSFDSISNKLIINELQIREDSTYFFFIKKTEEVKGSNGSFIYFANLADIQIEGIPFSNELENQLKSFHQLSYLKTHNNGSLPFKILFQSSPITIKAKVIEIKKDKEFNLILIESELGENIKVRTKELNCICEAGKIREQENYLFFLTPIDKGNYILTDRWLGVIQLNSITKHIYEIYKKRKAAVNQD